MELLKLERIWVFCSSAVAIFTPGDLVVQDDVAGLLSLRFAEAF
jgi:hypothetical protein